MKFSVIIPVYNAEQSLPKCLDSLIGQAADLAELILVNDGSTDSSGQICEGYARDYAQVVYISKENGGVSSARNAGLAVARGTYITFVDSDDYVSPDYFSALSEAPDTDFLFFSAVTERNSVQTGTIPGSALADAEDYPAFLRKFIAFRNGSPWNKRFRRSIIQENELRFPVDLFIGEDFVFCLRYLLHAKNACVSDRVLYHQDESNGTSLTRKYNERFLEQTLRIYSLSHQAISESALSHQQKDTLLCCLDYNRCRTAFVCVMEYFKLGNLSYGALKPNIKKVLAAFKEQAWDVEAVGSSHKGMRMCITKGWTFLSYCIAKRRFQRKSAAR